MVTVYISEQMRVENLVTGKYSYYTKFHDEWRRERFKDWQQRRICAERLECFHSATDKNHRREYTTLRMGSKN